jgi:hypothetical protein
LPIRKSDDLRMSKSLGPASLSGPIRNENGDFV